MRTASILDVYLLNVFATVSLSRDPITSLIFWIRSSVLLWDFALTLNSETLHTKSSKWFHQVHGRPNLLLPRLRKVLLEPGDELLQVGSQTGPLAVAAPLVHFSCCHKRISRSSRCEKIRTNFFLMSSILFFLYFFKANTLSHGATGAKYGDYHGSHSSLLINLCRNMNEWVNLLLIFKHWVPPC